MFGTARVRATSQNAQPMFIGIARTNDVARYLAGTGYGTIQHLATDEVTTHAGGAQSVHAHASFDLGGVDAGHRTANTPVEAAQW